MLKLTILINFILLVISLFSSLFVVYKDKGTTNRPFVALTIRVTLAFILLAQIAYGLFTNQIGSQAPWDSFPSKPAESQQATETTP